MPFDTTGNFSRVHNWEDDRLNDIDIVSDRHDEEDDNFAEGLTNCVCKDGRSIMSGNLNLGGYRISNLANAAASSDAVNKNQMEQALLNLENSLTSLIKENVNRRACIGDIKASTQTENHGNWILCDGQAVSRAVYADLFNLIGTSFGEGNGVTTFNVPDYRGKFLRGLGGNSAENMYTTQSEGLPNITGSIEGYELGQYNYGGGAGASGAFSASKSSYGGVSGHDGNAIKANFDASRSSSVYGASEHVTPINQAVNYFILAKNE